MSMILSKRRELVGSQFCDSCPPERNQARSPVWNKDKISHPVQMVKETDPDGKIRLDCRRCLTEKLSMLKRSTKK
jgi:hypothetical protein